VSTTEPPLTEITTAPPPARRAHPRVAHVVERFGLPLLLIAVVVYFSLAPASAATFWSAQNFRTIINNNCVPALCALALMVPLVAGQFDLSVAANVGISSMVMSALLAAGHAPLAVAIAACMATGAAVGLVNGILVAIVGVNSFVTTLGTSTVIGGIVLLYSNGQSIINGIPGSLTSFGAYNLAGIPRVFPVLLGTALVIWRAMAYTPFGRYLHAVGSSPAAARLVGIRVTRMILLSFVLGGALSGIAGVVLTAQSSGFNPQGSAGFLLPAFAAVFLGATMSAAQHFNVLGTMVAIFFVATVVSGLTLSGVQPWVQPVFQGAALVAAVAISALAKRRDRMRA
jgi:ribose transport system permease protein